MAEEKFSQGNLFPKGSAGNPYSKNPRAEGARKKRQFQKDQEAKKKEILVIGNHHGNSDFGSNLLGHISKIGLKAETEKKFFSEGEKSMKKKLTKKELIENQKKYSEIILKLIEEKNQLKEEAEKDFKKLESKIYDLHNEVEEYEEENLIFTKY